MEGDFKYLLIKHGQDGARSVFESACSKTLKKKFDGQAFQVKANPGDEGIDIFVGDFNKEIEVFQCKFFIDSLGDAQKKQIRESFKTAVDSKEYKMKRWVLCLPITLNVKEQSWWTKWKTSNKTKYKIEVDLWDSGDLLGLMRDHKVDEDVFDLAMQKQIRELHEVLIEKKRAIKHVLSPPADIDYSGSVFVVKLKSAKIEDHTEMFEKQFYNAEILEKQTRSKGIEREEKELDTLKSIVHDLWLTQYLLHKDSEDGNILIGKTCQRVEEEDEIKLKTILNANIIEKKGMLHQLADNCKLGWVADYKEKFKSLIDKENDRRPEESNS